MTLSNFVSLLFSADIMSMDDISHDWFDAQNHCSGRGLTIERGINGQPHWTGVYRRLSPWINILGKYLSATYITGKYSYLMPRGH